MKKIFIKPSVKVVNLPKTDIITGSGDVTATVEVTNPNGGGGDEDFE